MQLWMAPFPGQGTLGCVNGANRQSSGLRSLFLSCYRQCSQLLPAPTVLTSLPSWAVPRRLSQSV